MKIDLTPDEIKAAVTQWLCTQAPELVGRVLTINVVTYPDTKITIEAEFIPSSEVGAK
jgi:hypothetical protein